MLASVLCPQVQNQHKASVCHFMIKVLCVLISLDLTFEIEQVWQLLKAS